MVSRRHLELLKAFSIEKMKCHSITAVSPRDGQYVVRTWHTIYSVCSVAKGHISGVAEVQPPEVTTPISSTFSNAIQKTTL